MGKNNIYIFNVLSRLVPLMAVVLLVGSSSSKAAGVTPPRESGSAQPTFSLARSAIDFYQRYISDLRYGRCQFNPSCSRYAEEAIERFGFLKGSVLAADRLIRCNGSAHYYHERGADGRLLDPAIDEPAPRTHPAVPGWLMPAIEDAPARAAELDARLIENISFANALAERGDCWRAETEYLRVAFLAARPGVGIWAHMMIGRCYFRGEEWDEAAGAFLEAARSGRTRRWTPPSWPPRPSSTKGVTARAGK
jgi:putative membrane protein insertion efficiency factor